MTKIDPSKLRKNSKCYTNCNYWLTGPCCLLRQHCLLLSFLILLTLPRNSLQDDLPSSIDSDLMSLFSSADDPDSSEDYSGEPGNNKILDSFTSPSSPSTYSTSSQLPDFLQNTATPPYPPPSLKQPPPSSRSRLPGGGGGGRRDNPHHSHGSHHQKQTDPTVIANTPRGKIRGRTYYINKTGEWVGGFLGVPYAEPPIDRLRFRPPSPMLSLTQDENDVFNATEFGPICIQPADQKIWDGIQMKNHKAEMKKRKLSKYNISEDCLTLNIYVELVTSNGPKAHLSVPTEPVLPVFFFIHGGSYYMNAGRLYPGQILATAQKLIVVTFNYRLGPLGFLSTEDQEAPGNFGLLDQAMALDWIYQNIRHFGGDRNRITLVGNSAGAASVMYHMFSDLSKGKFVGITVQSGCSGAPWAIQPSPRRHAEDLATNLGCTTKSSVEMLDCMRNVSAEMIMQKAKLEDGLSLAYATAIDGKYGGKFLTDHPDALIRSRSFHPVPVLTGFTKDEVTIWFTKFGPRTKMKDLRSFVQVDVVSLMDGLDTVTQASMRAMIHSVTVQYLYRAGAKENDTFGRTGSISDFISDVGLKAPCIKEMNLLEKFNPKPVFLYEFVYSSVDDIKMNKQEWIGAYHESELQFIFGEAYMNYTNHLRSFNDKRISDFMMSIWGNFAKYGNPNPSPNKSEENGLKFKWTNYTEYNQDFAVLGLKSYMKKYFLTERMLFWNFFFPIFRDYPFQFNPKASCDEWEIISKSWTVWALLLVTLTSGFVVSMLIMLHLKRKLFSRLRATNNNTTTSSNVAVTGGVAGGGVGGGVILASGVGSGGTNNATSTSTTTTTTGSSVASSNHNHLSHHLHHHHHHHNILSSSKDKDSSSVNHRHSSGSSSNASGGSLLRGQHGNGGGSSSHLLHGANGTRALSSSNPGGGSSVPI